MPLPRDATEDYMNEMEGAKQWRQNMRTANPKGIRFPESPEEKKKKGMIGGFKDFLFGKKG
jgi:hypothetical protein